MDIWRDWQARIAWAPDDGEGNGEGEGAAAASDGGDVGTEAPSGAKSMMDLATPGVGKLNGAAAPDPAPVKDAEPNDSAAYKPDGMPEGMAGDTDRATIDNMLKALKGYQRTLSTKTEKAPSDASAYEVKSEGETDIIGEALNSKHLSSLMENVKAAALEAKMSPSQFDAFTRAFAASDTDMSWLVPPDQAAAVGAEQERDRLAGMVGGMDHAQAIIDHATGHFNRLAEAGVFSTDVDAEGNAKPGTDLYEWNVATSTAEGMSMISTLISALAHDKPAPTLGAREMGQPIAPREAQRMMSDALALPQGDERNAAVRAAESAFARIYRDDDGISLRSRQN